MSNKTNLRIKTIIDGLIGIVPALEKLISGSGSTTSIQLSMAFVKLNECKIWMERVYHLLDKGKYEEQEKELSEDDLPGVTNTLVIPTENDTEESKITFLINVLEEQKNELVYLSKLDHNFLFSLLGKESELRIGIGVAHERLQESILWLNERLNKITWLKQKEKNEAEAALQQNNIQTGTQEIDPSKKEVQLSEDELNASASSEKENQEGAADNKLDTEEAQYAQSPGATEEKSEEKSAEQTPEIKEPVGEKDPQVDNSSQKQTTNDDPRKKK